MCVAISYGRTTAAEAQEFAFCAFLKFLKAAIAIHLIAVIYIINVLVKDVAYRAVKATARQHLTRWQDCDMAVSAVAAIINSICISIFGYLKQTLLI
jgi:hypothetical protein